MSAHFNQQDQFLSVARRERTALTVFLNNGFQFKGVGKGFDSFTLMLEGDGRQRLVYKHAISTIVPDKPINMELPPETRQSGK
ncbi:MAG: RNA chaperone Hfq [Oscillospiraceae bacterium]|jgi:host factor-I protein|nr:RNA chaperone Hfq [Oscillospiraceae bacterium]